jgi:hypothetical protein
VLLLGEGDFGFAGALVATAPRPARVVATGLEDAPALHAKYPSCHGLAAEVRAACIPVTVVHGVDASRLAETAAGRAMVQAAGVVGWQFPFNGEADMGGSHTPHRVNTTMKLFH